MIKLTKEKVLESLFKPLHDSVKNLEVYYLTGVDDGTPYINRRIVRLQNRIYLQATVFEPEELDYCHYEGYVEIGFFDPENPSQKVCIAEEKFRSWDEKELEWTLEMVCEKFSSELNRNLKRFFSIMKQTGSADNTKNE